MSGSLSLRNAKMWILPFLAVILILSTSASKGRQRGGNPQNRYSLILKMHPLRTAGGIQAPSWRFALGRAVWTRSQWVPPAWQSHTGCMWGISFRQPLWALQCIILLLPITSLGVSMMYFKLKDSSGLCDALPGLPPWAEGSKETSLVPIIWWGCCILYLALPKTPSLWFLILWDASNLNLVLAPHWKKKTNIVSQQQTMI